MFCVKSGIISQNPLSDIRELITASRSAARPSMVPVGMTLITPSGCRLKHGVFWDEFNLLELNAWVNGLRIDAPTWLRLLGQQGGITPL